MITENLSTLNIHRLTNEQYKREFEAGRLDDNALYLTPDEEIDLSEYAKINDVPIKVSELENDSNYLTEEIDPTVPAWAKAETKPTYTASEVGAEEAGAVIDHNTAEDAHRDIRELITKIINDIPTGLLADKDEVSEEVLEANLSNKINEAYNAKHSHSNKETLDSITAANIENWNNAESKANQYTDTTLKTLDPISKNEADTKISTHNISDTAHGDIRELVKGLSDKVTHFLDVDEETTDELSEVLDLISKNKGTLDSLLEDVLRKSDIIDNLTTNSSDKVLSAAQGVVIKELIKALQDELAKHTFEYAGSSTEGGAANSAIKLETARNITLNGDVVGEASFDGSKDVLINVTVQDDSHNHIIDNVDGLGTKLEGLQPKITGGATSITDNNLTASRALASDANGKVAVSNTTSAELAHLSGVKSSVQGQLDGKQPMITGAATSITNDNLTASRALVSDANGKVIVSDVTSAELKYLDGVEKNIQEQLDAKANSSDIAKTVMQGTATQSNTYWKISDFGNWGTGNWTMKGFSMLITSRAGEMIWVSLAANDSNTSANAIRLVNRYSKIAGLYYSVSESAIYVLAAAWANNICAHIMSNVNGDYVPKVSSASALPSDATSINIVEFGVTSDSTVVGDNSSVLKLGSSGHRPIYNESDALTLFSEFDGHEHPISEVIGLQDALDGKVDLSTDQIVNGNKVFTGTTSTMTLHTYNPLHITNGTDNAKSTNLYTNDSNIFAITSSAGDMTFNGESVALESDINSLQSQLNSYVKKAGDTMSGRLQLNMANPHIHMKDTGYSTDWYFQAYQDQLAFGPTFANAVKTDKNGNMTVPGVVKASNYRTDDTAAAIKPSDSNEVNFGSNASYIYFGYDNRVGSAGVITTYNFGRHSGAAGASDGDINCGAISAGRLVNGGRVNGKTVTVDNKAVLQYDSTNECLNFTFA